MASCLTKAVRRLRRNMWHGDIVAKIAREPLWLKNSQYKPERMDSTLSSLDAQLQVGGARGSSSVGRGDEIEILCREGHLNRALDVLLSMDEQGSRLPVNVYSCMLKACSKSKALPQAKRVHSHLVKRGLECTSFLWEYLVVSFVKCGGLEDALQVFRSLPHRSVLSWTAVISGYNMSGKPQEALRMYQYMKEEGVRPDTYTFVSLLKACGSLANLKEGKRIHAEALRYNCEADLFVRSCLVDMYRKCGSIFDARNVFDGLTQRDVVSWTIMLAAYVEQGQAEEALDLYEQMLEEGVNPNDRTFMSVLQACGMIAEKDEYVLVNGQFTKVKSWKKGRVIHADANRQGYGSDVFVCTILASMYGKCGSINDARCVFDRLCQPDVASCNTMLAVYAKHGEADKAYQLYQEMQEKGITQDARTFVSMLQACTIPAEKEEDVVVEGHSIKVSALEKGKSVHADARMKGYDSDLFVANALISMYGKCGDILDAEDLFDKLSHLDVVSWTSMLVAYVLQGQAKKALLLYERMHMESVSPDVRTIMVAVQACVMLAQKEEFSFFEGRSLRVKCLQVGKAMHAAARRKGYDSDVYVGSIVMSMYSKCGSTMDAKDVFDGLRQRDVVAWTAILAAYVEQGQAECALDLYEQMQEEGVSPNDRTIVNMLQACGILADKEDVATSSKVKSLKKGTSIHDDARRKGYESDIFVGSTLVSMYGKCGNIVEARNVFDRLSSRNVVTWNAMLAAYGELGQGEEALELYGQMRQEGVTPDDITLVCILQACSYTGRLGTLRDIHNTLVSTKIKDFGTFLASTLINAYGRCASMVDARAVFDALPQANVVSWNALIAGYAREGNSAASLQCYSEMLLAGVKPDGVTYLSLLCACSHAGLVEKGIEYFESMSRDHGITPEIAHYASMMDLLGRAGCFTGVEDLLSTMPMQPDLPMLLCVLGACRKHSKVVLGEQIFACAVHLQPTHAASYVIMSNIYANVGLLERAENVKLFGHQAGAWTKPGQSWIEHDQDVEVLVVGDKMHSQRRQLYELLGIVSSQLDVLLGSGGF